MSVAGVPERGSIIPYCSHGYIILACPHDFCPEQNEYLERHQASLDEYIKRQQEDARRLVREAMGIER